MFGGFPQRIDPFAGETWTGIATSSKMSRRPRTASDARIVTRRALDRWYSVAAGSTCTPVPLIRRGYRRRCRLLCAVPILLGYVCPASAGRGQSIIGCRSPEKWRQDPIRLATPLAAADRCRATFHRASIARPGSFGVVRGHPPTSLDQGSRIYALVGMALFYVAKVGVAGSNPVVRSTVVRSRSEALPGASVPRSGPSIANPPSGPDPSAVVRGTSSSWSGEPESGRRGDFGDGKASSHRAWAMAVPCAAVACR